MMALQSDILLIVYAPALVGGDRRPLVVVSGMERAFPGLRLDWTISDEGKLVLLPQRDTWVIQGKPDGGFPLLCNGGEDYRVTVYGLANSAMTSSGGQAQCDIHVELPLDKAGIAAAANVLEEVAEGARAFWGHATPRSAAGDIAEQTSPTPEGPPCPPRGLPALRLPWNIRSPVIPHRLGWLNYWSAATAQAIGFPDPARDADLLSRSRHTQAEGWIVQLTDEPLDLDNPAHLDAVFHAYERFPAIGGRLPL